jgi:hypothetical protein
LTQPLQKHQVTQKSPTFSLYNILNSPIFVSFRYRHKATGPLT